MTCSTLSFVKLGKCILDTGSRILCLRKISLMDCSFNHTYICTNRIYINNLKRNNLDRKRSEEEVFKENETSRWKKVWNNIFKKIKRGKKKV